MKEQIEEMARIIDDNHGFIVSSVETAEALYNAGYRKQKEGEWETIPLKPRGEMFNGYSHICSACNFSYIDVLPNGYKFCPECGAHMRGGKNE